MAKLTQKEVKKRFKKAKIKLMDNYENSETRYRMRCFCGKIFYSKPRLIFEGNTNCCGCIYKIGETKTNSRLKLFGFKLAQKYENVDCVSLLKCSCGKIFKARLSNVFKMGIKHKGCKNCGRGFDLNIEEVKALCLKKGFEFLDTYYKGSHHRHNFRCIKHNEIHFQNIKSIKTGQGLKCCGISKNILTDSEVENKLKEKGFNLLEKYTMYHRKHIFGCIKHNEKFYCKMSTVLQGRKLGCTTCRVDFFENRIYKTGKDSPVYKHELSDVERKYRRAMYKGGVKKWRKLVMDKRGRICEKCTSSVEIAVHHIKNWADNEKLRLDVNNGCVLCTSCHRKFHNIYGNKNTNATQLRAFLK